MKTTASRFAILTLALLSTLAHAAEGNALFQQRLKLAEQSDARAQAYVALRYNSGRDGVAKNPADALRWFIAAADLRKQSLYMGRLAHAHLAGDFFEMRVLSVSTIHGRRHHLPSAGPGQLSVRKAGAGRPALL